jgi:hypothetical protein
MWVHSHPEQMFHFLFFPFKGQWEKEQPCGKEQGVPHRTVPLCALLSRIEGLSAIT